MNIGFFTDSYFPQVSGVSTSIKLLKDYLTKQGHQVVIFTTTDPDAVDEVGVVRLPSIPFASFDDRRIAFAGFDKCLKIAKKYHLDIIHTHTEFSLGLAGKYVASRLKIPTVHTYHTLYEQYTHYIMNGMLIRPTHVRILSKQFCNQTDGVIVPSDMMRTKLKSYGVKTEMRIISTGVEVPDYQEGMREAIRAQYHIADDDRLLLSLSRLSKEKSIDEVIKMYATLITQHDNVKLMIVGDGPARQQLELLAYQLNVNVIFVGEIPYEDVWKYYQAADLYVNASTSETQGLTYIEAMANHLPVVAHYNDYLANVMTDESLGRLYGDYEEFAPIVSKYLTDMHSGNITPINTDKLYPLSAENFAQQVSTYYHDIITSFKANRDLTIFDTIYSAFTKGYEEMFGLSEKPKTGFIGLGVMGKSMAKHLMDAGYDIVVYNRTPEKANDLVKSGAIWADTPEKVAELSDIVFTIVGYPTDVEEVYFGEKGLFKGAHKGNIFVDMTTSTPTLAEKIAIEARRLGIDALDAPVSGGDKGAREARLTTMVGGDKAIFDKVLPLFETFSSKVRLQGGNGAGQHTKMANQIMIAGTMLGMVELLVYAKAAKLNLDSVIDTVSSGSGQNWSLSNYAPRILKEDYSPGFFSKHFLKDLKIALDEAHQMDLELPMADMARELYQVLCEQGNGEDGTQALIKLWWETV